MLENRAEKRVLPPEDQDPGLSKGKQSGQAEAQSRLRKSGYHELHLVSCDFHEGVLTCGGAYRAST